MRREAVWSAWSSLQSTFMKSSASPRDASLALSGPFVVPISPPRGVPPPHFTTVFYFDLKYFDLKVNSGILGP